MTIVVTAFERSPDGGKGLARDTRVRWALEEAGLPYDVRLVSFQAMKEPAHLALHPFGQIPTFEDGDLALFETGAIVLHIAEHHGGLLPNDGNARARAIAWMFAAVNTIEPPILELVTAKILEADKPWTKDRLPLVMDRIRERLNQLSVRMGESAWLDGAFSAGDLMMVSVLLRLRPSGPGRVSKPVRLCCARRGAARLQAGVRSPAGRQRAASLRLSERAAHADVARNHTLILEIIDGGRLERAGQRTGSASVCDPVWD
jgi:glutathione S-transferase